MTSSKGTRQQEDQEQATKGDERTIQAKGFGRVFLWFCFHLALRSRMGQQFTNAEGEQTEIDVAELQEWYKKFVVECPSGTLFMHEFKRFFGVQDNHEAAEYIENMFRAFDKNGVSGEEVLQSFI